MGFAFGGLAVLSVPSQLGLWSSAHRFAALVEVRSMFLALLVTFIVLVLAYLTNPSETSFRAFLTEQSFRHHLSRLDDAQDDQQIDHTNRSLLNGSDVKHSSSNTSAAPFQFADRASVSLRTPKHFFRSFGVLSVAAVLPSTIGHGDSRHRLDGTNPSLINDSWFVGAFGMWWWAAHLDGFWRDVGIVGAKEEDGSSLSGILELKALDRYNERSGISFSTGNHHQTQSRAGAKHRSRERFIHQSHSTASNVVVNRRSSSPPPLPRSASLPLHAKRIGIPSTNPSTQEHSKHHGAQTNMGQQQTLQQQQTQSHHQRASSTMAAVAVDQGIAALDGNSNSYKQGCHLLTTSSQSVTPSSASPHVGTTAKSPTAVYAQSPKIAEILRQVGVAQTSVGDLQEQLSAASTAVTANVTTKQLQSELEQQRARKQTDDTTRTELRTRTRALEDAKRHAESSKREVEKRLKQAQSTVSASESRAFTLSEKANSLQDAVKSHSERAERSQEEANVLCEDLKEEVEGKKAEIKEVDEVVSALVKRVKELEGKVEEEEERLRKALEEAAERDEVENSSKATMVDEDGVISNGGTPGVAEKEGLAMTSPWPVISPLDPLLKPRSLSVQSNPLVQLQPGPAGDSPATHSLLNETAPSKVNGYTFPNFAPLSIRAGPRATSTTTFSPFSPTTDHTNLEQQQPQQPTSPLSSSFIPSGLIESLGISPLTPTTPSSLPMPILSATPTTPLSDSLERGGEVVTSPLPMLSRSFQSDDDVILDRKNGSATSTVGLSLAPGSGSVATSATATPASLSPILPNLSLVGEHHRPNSNISNGLTGNTDTAMATGNVDLPVAAKQPTIATRRWFAKERKGQSASVSVSPGNGGGLNPDAKEFNLPKDRARTLSFFLSKPRSGSVGNTDANGNGNGNGIIGRSLFDNGAQGRADSLSTVNGFLPATTEVVTGSPTSTPRLSSPVGSIRSSTNSSNKMFALGGIGSTWFGASPSAFAPTPTEREALTRALAGGATSKNASVDRLDRIPAASVTSLPASPQPMPTYASANNFAGSHVLQSPGLISRSAWMGELASSRGGKSGTETGTVSTAFSPFNDAERNPIDGATPLPKTVNGDAEVHHAH